MSDRGYKNSSKPDNNEDDDPPFSRVFVVCSREISSNELRDEFEKCGEIENLHMPRDRQTGDVKGVAYIKFKKTSSAAKAIKDLNQRSIANSNKPLKVMLACKKSDATLNIDAEKYKRLFIKVGKDEDVNDVKHHFNQFCPEALVHFIKNKETNENKGVAFVNFPSFLDAAIGYEECNKKYRPMFATPKDDLKRQRNSYDSGVDLYTNNHEHLHFRHEKVSNDFRYEYPNSTLPKQPRSDGFTKIIAQITPPLHQRFIERLFNVVSEMTNFKYNIDSYNGIATAHITYSDHKSAYLAVEKLDNFEFPSGELVTVKPDNLISKAASDLTTIVKNFKDAVDSGSAGSDLIQLADAIAQASSLIKVATGGRANTTVDESICNVKLPPPQPLVNSNTPVAMRLFIVCKPTPPPIAALRDVFSRFSDMIDIIIIRGKNFGFVKYASTEAGLEATRCIDGAMICGKKMAVCEAESRDDKDKTDDNNMK